MRLRSAELGIAFLNSLKLAAGTAVIGTSLIFMGAYLLEKTSGLTLRPLCACWRCCRWRCPGLVLGLGYIFFFNAPGNPLTASTRRWPLLVICTVVHFYTTGPPHGGHRAEAARRRVRGGLARP